MVIETVFSSIVLSFFEACFVLRQSQNGIKKKKGLESTDYSRQVSVS